MSDGLFLTCPAFDGEDVVHGFSTRLGGVSRPPYNSLNLGFTVGDDPAAVAENLARLRRAAGIDGRGWWTANQVHGAHTVVITRRSLAPREGVSGVDPGALEGEGGIGRLGDADALICDVPGQVIGVRVADCVPLLLAGPGGGVVAAVHAGWRGTAARIVPRVIGHLEALFGVAPGALRVAIGPAIGPESYEVGPQVVAALEAALGDHRGPAVIHGGRGGSAWVDLGALNQELAVAAGVPREQIWRVEGGVDTALDTRRCFSHRRDGGVTGRMVGFIGRGRV